MSRAAPLEAPAKVNLGLRVVGRRPDGYHLLESLFVPLELADRLTVEVEPATATTVSLALASAPGGVPAGEENLAVRAARAFLAAVRRDARVAIELEKRIPAGAGLGGGSSDAAAVLRALSNRFANAIAEPDLAGLALRLGADVPFFLDPRPAWVSGIGERVEPLWAFPSLVLLLATPSPPLSTAAVFRAWDVALTPGGPGRRMPELREEPDPRPLGALVGGGAEGAGGLEGRAARAGGIDPRVARASLTNDLEPVAARLHPAIDRVRTELERCGARAVAMSGSGPTMFGVFDDEERARCAAREGHWQTTDRVLVSRTRGAP